MSMSLPSDPCVQRGPSSRLVLQLPASPTMRSSSPRLTSPQSPGLSLGHRSSSFSAFNGQFPQKSQSPQKFVSGSSSPKATRTAVPFASSNPSPANLNLPRGKVQECDPKIDSNVNASSLITAFATPTESMLKEQTVKQLKVQYHTSRSPSQDSRGAQQIVTSWGSSASDNKHSTSHSLARAGARSSSTHSPKARSSSYVSLLQKSAVSASPPGSPLSGKPFHTNFPTVVHNPTTPTTPLKIIQSEKLFIDYADVTPSGTPLLPVPKPVWDQSSPNFASTPAPPVAIKSSNARVLSSPMRREQSAVNGLHSSRSGCLNSEESVSSIPKGHALTVPSPAPKKRGSFAADEHLMVAEGVLHAICPKCRRVLGKEGSPPPLGLRCGHSLCKECCVSHMKEGAISCPACLQTTDLCGQGADALNTNYALAGLHALSLDDLGRQHTNDMLDGIGAACLVCLEVFAPSLAPYVLTCGHSICEHCCQDKIVACPLCGMGLEEMTVNKPLLKVIEALAQWKCRGPGL